MRRARVQAATAKQADVMHALIVARADPNVQLPSAAISTALQIAAQAGQADAVVALLEGGAEADTQSQSGCTALHHSVSNAHAGVAAVLLAARCDPDIQNANGSTALHMAASKGYDDILKVRSLLERGGFDAVHVCVRV